MDIPAFDLRKEPALRGPLSGTKVHVEVQEEPHSHRKLMDVLKIVDRVQWPGAVRDQIEDAFTVLAKAEGRVHGKAYDQIHFHEVGCYDAIVDICGTLLGLNLLGVETCFCSKLHVGEGFVKTRHGRLPLPVPATAHLIQGFDVYSLGLPMEMVTPTGAALLHVLAGGSSPMPVMRLDTTGYGAGTRDPKEVPGMLRVFLGETTGAGIDRVVMIEASIDDMNPEFFEPLMENLFDAGALDVTFTPLMMKKNRPGTLISVLVPPALKETAARILLRDSTTIGVRFYECERRTLQRELCEVQTKWGMVKGKVCWGEGIEKRFTPEYEDCKRIHSEKGVPIAEVYREAVQCFLGI